MRVHFDVLGWLHVCAGAFGLLTGAALAVLALGTTTALTGRAASVPAAGFLLASGLVFALVGTLTMLVGRAVVGRRPLGRTAALVLAVPSLAVIPFGTALAIYTFWTLLNDEARRAFGKRPG